MDTHNDQRPKADRPLFSAAADWRKLLSDGHGTVSAPLHPARWLILGAGSLQGPFRPVIDLVISPFRTTQRNPTHAAADCRPTPSKLAICFCALPTCPTGCRLHSPFHLNTEEKGEKRRKEFEIRRENWLGWKVSRPYRTTYKYREDNSRSGTR
jgi:hypothetical protein